MPAMAQHDLSERSANNEGDGLGQTVKRIKEILCKTAKTVPESEFKRIGDAITDGDFDALALFRKGLKPSCRPQAKPDA